MKHGKKLLSVFLSLVMLLGLLPTSALAVETLSGTQQLESIAVNKEYIFAEGLTLRSPTKVVSGKNNVSEITIQATKGTPASTTFTLAGNVNVEGQIQTSMKDSANDPGNPANHTITIDGKNYTLTKIKITDQLTQDDKLSNYLFYLRVGTLNLKDITLAAENGFVENTDYKTLGTLLFYGSEYPTATTLDNVTFQNAFKNCIRWPNGKVTVQVKNALTFTGSKAEEIYLVNGDSVYVPFNFNTGSSVVCKDASNKDAQVRIKLDEDLKNTDNPFKFATGKAITPAWANKFTCTNENHVVYYKDEALYIAHKDNTAYTDLKVSISDDYPSNYKGDRNTYDKVPLNTPVSGLTVSPKDGWKFSSNVTPDLTALNRNLAEYGLSAKFENGKIEISGNLYGNVNLSNISGWPRLEAVTYIVNLGTNHNGLDLIDPVVPSAEVPAGESYTATFEADEDHILDTDYHNKLNNGILQGTGLNASIEDGKLKITGTITKDVDLSSETWPAMTKTEAMVGTSKYDSLANAITAADEGTVVMKKDPDTAVTNATLKNGVTLQDTSGNTYTAKDAAATVSVGTDGNVTLTGGKLDVTPKDSETTASVEVTTGTSTKTTVSGSDPFTVTAAKGDGSGGEGNDKATVTIAEAYKSVTTDTGLTFTAGQDGSTFPLDGSKLNNGGDAVTVAGGKTAEVEVGEIPAAGESGSATPIKVKVPGTGTAATTDAVTVTKGDGTNTMATVTVKKAGDSFTVGGKTYVAGANDTEFTIDKDGNVKLTSGGITLGDGESVTGIYSGKTIKNPDSSSNDQVTVEGVPANSSEAAYDKVTVPKGGSGSVHIQYLDTYANKSANKDLVLKVTQSGVSVLEGEITTELVDERNMAGIASGATIANPGDSGDDTITVTSDKDKDRVTVPAGTDKSVTITKAGASTGETYFNGAQANASLVIDVTAAGASLSTGNVALRENQGIGVYGNTITYTNSNNSEEPLTVRIYGVTSNALIDLEEGRSFTDKDGNTYTAKNGKAEFAVDKTTGKIQLAKGSAEVTPAANAVPPASIKVAKMANATNDADFYTVSGSEKFTVTAGSGGATATVTLPAGKSATSGSLTFTAGANVGDNGSTFPLDGSALNNNGDKLTVAGAENSDITVKVGTTTGESATDINVTIPGGNLGATTITKGTPTIVKIGNDDEKFKVNGTDYPTGTTKAGEEYAIDTDGTVTTVTKIEAKVFDDNGTMVGCGGLASMLNNPPYNAKTIEMVIAPASDVTNKTLKNGVTLKDLDGNRYKANGADATISVDATGKVSLTEGKLDVTPAATKTASVAVAKKDNASSADDFTTVSGEEPFTVTAGKGTGDGSTDANAKATVTIPTKGKTVTVGTSADAGLIFTAGTANSTFPLDGSKLNNNGDSITVGKDCGEHKVALGSGDNAAEITVPAVNTGATTVTKGQPAGFDGKVTLGKSGDKFTVGGTEYTAAANDTTFAVKKDGDTTTAALVSGAVNVPAGGSTDVRPDVWSKSVKVENPNGDTIKVSVVPGTSDNPAKGKAEVASGKSVTIGDKTYTAKAANTAFLFDENGKVTLDSGKVELDKTESILGGVSGVEIKNTSAESITDPVTVEKGTNKDTVTVPAGGKVTIGGKEYTANGGEMKLEIDADGNVTLADGKADFGKDTSLNLNGAVITNTKAGSDLSMTKSGGTGTLHVAEGGSFTVGTGTVKDPSADMSFTIDSEGNVTAALTEGESVTINGVKYTAEGSAELKLDKDGNVTSISDTCTPSIPGMTTYQLTGRVMLEATPANTAVSGATVKLTQGGKEVIRIAPVKTNSNGEYAFPAVPAGTYNVVVEKDGKTLTQLVTVSNGNVTVGDLVLPGANVSSVVDVKPTSPVGAMVGGLDTVAGSNSVDGSKVTITLEVDQADTNAAIAALAGSKTLVSMNFTVNKKVNDATPSNITDTTTVLEIILTFDTSNKTNITVYRYHGVNAEALTKLDSRPSAPYTDGTYYVGNGFVVVYTSKFSPYAIGYDVVSSSGGSGASSGSGSGASVGKTQNGTVTVSPKNAKVGETVTVTVKPDEGYKLGTLTVTDKDGNKLTLTKISDTQYTYVAPNGKVDVQAAFVMAVGYADCAKDSTCPICAYPDALATAWYHDGVHYCLDEGLMKGYDTGKFGPADATSRSQIVTILWRLENSPVVTGALNFRDVEDGAWYAEAIRWAVREGIALGYGDGSFGPDDTVTREQLVTILYRYARYKGYGLSADAELGGAFADADRVSAYAVPAMRWACGSGLVNGVELNGTLTLNPLGATSRVEMATLIMRFCVEIVR